MGRFSGYDIIISSYLTDDPEVQRTRLDIHLKQRSTLYSQFIARNVNIVSLCTAYPDWAKEKMYAYNCIFQDKHQYKYQDHQQILRGLYKEKTLKSILLLDDDTVPTILPDLKSSRNILDQIEDWLNNPENMPASCIYFATKGLLPDIYYNARKPVLGPCPVMPSGWATLVRSDLKVNLTDEDIWLEEVQMGEDTIFRNKCAVEGKEVLKHFGLFFETFQNKSNDKNSAWFRGSREARRESVRVSKEYLAKKYPWIFTLKGKILKPIWSVKGARRKSMIAKGLLIKTDFGVVPNSKMLEKEYHNKPEQYNLLDD